MHVDDVIKKIIQKKKFLNNNVYINDCDNDAKKKNELKKKISQFKLGWPRRSGSPSEVRRFRADESNFVI